MKTEIYYILKKVSLADQELNKLINIKSISELSILYSDFNPYLTSYIIAPSNIQQLVSSIKFIKVLEDLNLSRVQKEKIYTNINRLFHG